MVPVRRCFASVSMTTALPLSDPPTLRRRCGHSARLPVVPQRRGPPRHRRQPPAPASSPPRLASASTRPTLSSPATPCCREAFPGDANVAVRPTQWPVRGPQSGAGDRWWAGSGPDCGVAPGVQARQTRGRSLPPAGGITGSSAVTSPSAHRGGVGPGTRRITLTPRVRDTPHWRASCGGRPIGEAGRRHEPSYDATVGGLLRFPLSAFHPPLGPRSPVAHERRGQARAAAPAGSARLGTVTCLLPVNGFRGTVFACPGECRRTGRQ